MVQKYGMAPSCGARWRAAGCRDAIARGAETPQSRRAARIPERYDLSLPANQRKLEVVEQLAVAG
ncbi:hypothetical protein GCM10020219_079630 [Nonomuraea dietziae]